MKLRKRRLLISVGLILAAIIPIAGLAENCYAQPVYIARSVGVYAEIASVENSAPELREIGNKTGEVGQAFSITNILATDADGDDIEWTIAGLPEGAVFTEEGSQPGYEMRSINWAADLVEAGVYNVTITVSDGTLQDSETFTITINDISNTDPYFYQPIGNRTGQVGTVFRIPSMVAMDNDKDSLTLTATGLPAGALFRYVASSPGYIAYNVAWNKPVAGVYRVTFTVTDEHQAFKSEAIFIYIKDASGNTPPYLNPIGNRTGTAGQTFAIPNIIATDIDGASLTITASPLPPGAGFILEESNAGYTRYRLRWLDTKVIPGVFTVTFTASDGTLTDSETITIFIEDATGNIPPYLEPIGNKTGLEREDFSIASIKATDIRGDALTLTAAGLPDGAQFTQLASSPGLVEYRLFWPAVSVIPGDYQITFTAADAGLTDSETITISIAAKPNTDPYFYQPIGNRTGQVGTVFRIPSMVAMDNDKDSLTLTATGLPAGALFRYVASSPGYIAYNVAWNKPVAGVYRVTFTVTDEHQASKSETIFIYIKDASGNTPPYLNPIGNRTGTAGQTFAIPNIIATDIDGASLTITASPLPPGAGFILEESTAGYARYRLRWLDIRVIPGVFTVTFAASDGTLTDSETITIAIEGYDPDLPKALDIESIPDTGILPLQIQFNAILSQGWNPPCTWHLDQGVDETGQSVTHLYEYPGDYLITCRADDGRDVLEKTKTIRIFEDEPANIPGNRALFVWTAWDQGDSEEWQRFNGLARFDTIGDGTLNTAITASEAFMQTPQIAVDTSKLKKILVRYKITNADILTGKFTWMRNIEGIFANSETFPIINDGQFHTYEIDLSLHANWTDYIRYLRFYPTIGVNGHAVIDYIRIVEDPLTPSADDINWEFNPGTKGIVTNPIKRKELLDFCYLKDINLIFLNSQGVVYGTDADRADFTAFINEAHQRGFSVYGLQGRSWWSVPEAANKPGQLWSTEHGLQYTQAVINYGQFDGIVDDTEPYTADSASWNANLQQRAQWYIDWVQGCQTIVNGQIPFISVIPFWFDTRLVALNGDTATKPLNQYVSDIADSVCIMAYRDFADTSDGIIQHSLNEITYGQSWVAVEVQYLGTGTVNDKLSFYEEGEAYMETELGKVENYYSSYTNYKGVAIHYYLPYKFMNY